MVSPVERERILRESWVDAKYRVPDTAASGPHFPVTVLGVIHDPNLIVRDSMHFVDIVSWWPAQRTWTVTHQCRADDEAADYPCNVTHWQQLPPLPWG